MAHGGPASAVAVVGAGVRTPAGNSVASLWDALCAGRSFAEVYEDPRLPPGADVLACRVCDLDPRDVLPPVDARRLDRAHALAFAAATDALRGASGSLPPPERRAVVCGVGLGSATTYEEQFANLYGSGLRSMSPLTVPVIMPSSVAAYLSLRLDVRGPCVTVSAACASGAAAIAEGVELIRRDAADVVVAGGVDALLGYAAMSAFMRLDAMSRNVGCPALASRPFDVDRDGFVMGEGAGFVLLCKAEDVDALASDGVLGWVVGHASTSDAHHLVAPHPDGDGALRCMWDALADAGAEPAAVTHVNAHGTSTVLNDRAEAAALTALFGGPTPPVTAVKGATGHLIGGSGAVEAIIALEALRRRTVPPVAGLRTVDPEITIDVVHGAPRALEPGLALSNSFGFGGVNTVLVLA